MESLLLNYEYLKRCNYATTKKVERQILRGVCIQDRNENGRFYRYYIGCDGAMFVGYKLRIDKIQVREIVLNMNDFKISRENEKKIIDNGGYLIFDKAKDSQIRYITDFGNVFAIDGVFPNYLQLFSKEFKVAEKMVLISYEKHRILNQFWKTNERFYKIFERTFFVSKNAKDETNVPLFNFQKITDKNVLKFSAVMPIRASIDFDLKELKKFDF